MGAAGTGANLAERAFITIMDDNVFLLDNGLTKSFCQFFLCSFSVTAGSNQNGNLCIRIAFSDFL